MGFPHLGPWGRVVEEEETVWRLRLDPGGWGIGTGEDLQEGEEREVPLGLVRSPKGTGAWALPKPVWHLPAHWVLASALSGPCLLVRVLHMP